MKKTLGSLAVGALAGLAPTAVAGHQGHAGDHGWLFGALQPWLSVDHLLSALVVVAVFGAALAVLGRVCANRRDGALTRTASPSGPVSR